MIIVGTCVDPNWSEYDKSVGRAQLANYGHIYLDEFDKPVDDEYLLEEMHAVFCPAGCQGR